MKHIGIIIDGIDDRDDWFRELSRRAVLHVLKTNWTFEREVWVAGERMARESFPPCPDIISLLHGCFSRLRFLAFLIVHCAPLDLLVMDRTYGVVGVLFRWLRLTRRFVSIHSAVPVPGSAGARLTDWCCHFASRHADEVWVYSWRLPYGRNQDNRRLVRSNIRLVDLPGAERTGIFYLSAGSPNHMLPALFDLSRKHAIPLHIVGSLDPHYFLSKIQHLAPPLTTFHGFKELDELPEIAAKCFCGWAVYEQTSGDGFEFYGFPAKYLRYLSLGLPILTTDVSEFSREISRRGLGMVVDPAFGELDTALTVLRDNDQSFSNHIATFAAEWNEAVRAQFRNIREEI